MKASAISLIKKILGSLGLEVRRVRELNDIYPTLYAKEILDERRFYNIGAGSFFHKYWTNIDYESDWYKGVQKGVRHYDLMSFEPLPIDSSVAELIYTSHTIEHVTDKAVKNLFSECFRVLKPGGGLRITTGPDAETDFKAMLRGDLHWFYWDEAYVAVGSFESIFRAPANSVPIEERWLHHVASQLAPNDISPSEFKFNAEKIKGIISEKGFEGSLDYFASLCEFNPKRPGNHISWWSHNKIEKYLRDVGFNTVYRSGYGQSAFPVLRDIRHFDSTHPQMSIYVEAIK